MKKPSAPILDIADSNGTLLPSAQFSTTAVMLYPEDGNARNKFLDALQVQVVSGLLHAAAEEHGSAEEARLQKRGKDWICQQQDELLWQAIKQVWFGSIAGYLLMWIFKMAEHSPPASLNKAVRIVEVYLTVVPGFLGQRK